MTHPRLLTLLLPSHGMEDLPDAPEEAEAEELLAAFACLAHPAAVLAVDRPPIWDRADMPPALHEGDVVLVPAGCDVWMEPTWIPEVEAAGVTVLRGHEGLEGWFDAVSDAFGAARVDRSVREAFAGVGLMRLFVERFARRMHNFDGIDESRYFDSLKAVAEKANDVDGDELRTMIASCYDTLLEYRERIHPIDPHLIDVVMLAESDGEHLAGVLGAELAVPVNLMADQPCWQSILASHPDVQESVSHLLADRRAELLLGESEECETRLEPIEVTAGRLQAVRQWSIDTFGRPPRTWARREYGLHPDLPALLKSAGYQGAVHLTFDVGPYPDTEDAKMTWQAPDRTGLESFARLPIPGGRAATFWQFSERLGESVEYDAVAAAMFVRWADSDPWWYRVFREASAVGPVFGRFVTLGEFLTEADGHSTVLRPFAREYGSAALAKRAALKKTEPLGEEVDRWARYVSSIGERVCGGLASVITGGESTDDPSEALAHAVAGDGEPTGTMVLNPSPIERIVAVTNANGEPVAAVAPPYGYAWVADDAKPAKKGQRLVEDRTLRNEFFELLIGEKTGGVQRLRQYGRRGNFFSQQLGRRLTDIGEEQYASAVAGSIEIVEDSTMAAAIRSAGELRDHDGRSLARFEQTVRVVRGRPWFDIEVTIDGSPIEDGNPWIEYDAVRFAWSSGFAAVSQSCGLSPTPASKDRMESPLFIEVDDDPTITILTRGYTFHRRSDRKLDTLIGVAGESQKTVRFSVAVGVRNPAAAAIGAMTSDEAFVVRSARPRIESAWLASVDRAGVTILGITPESAEDGTPRFVVRLQETNAAAGVATVRLCRPACEALARDLSGRMTDRLTIRDGAIEVRVREHQMRDIVVKLA